MDKEPEIIINGVLLSDSASMTIRVAIESFAMDLENNGLGDDPIGLTITKNYLESIALIRKAIFRKEK